MKVTAGGFGKQGEGQSVKSLEALYGLSPLVLRQ